MYRSAAGIKCVTVGDGTVGKTCMLVSYANNRFPREHVPTVFDNYAVTVMAGEQPINLMLFDTAGQEDYDRLRVLCYPGSDVIVLCFCVTNPASFLNIEQKWVPELKLNCPGVPIVLVGTKVDLRDDQEVMERLQKKRERPITSKKGEKLAARIGATCYIECSALTQKGLKDVYDSAILSVIEPKKSKPKQSSSILSCIRR